MNSAKPQPPKTDFPSILEGYFCNYLRPQRNASPETISSYRDTFRLFLPFSEQRFRKMPSSLTLADLDAPHRGMRGCWQRAGVPQHRPRYHGISRRRKDDGHANPGYPR